MAIKTRAIEYQHEGTTLEGVIAFDDEQSGERPAVMISHAWAGRDDIDVDFAKRLARLGYSGFALDLYGKGVRGKSVEENQKLMTPFMKDRSFLQARLLHALDVVKTQPEADAENIVVMGFCFGGLCALDLARTGVDIKGAASFHGIFAPPGNTDNNEIKAKVIAYHGWDDPMVKPDDVVAFAREMTEMKADWQLLAFGNTMHAFTNPHANDPGFGTVYNKAAADRSWTSLTAFLKECFA